MRSSTLVAVVLALVLGFTALLYADRTAAQPLAQAQMGPGGQMMGSQQPLGQMMGQMQQQVGQMTMNLKTMRAQLDRVNPAMLTPSERTMFDYLKLLQTHMETMQAWMGTAQGAMMQMSGTRR